MDFAASQR